MELIFAIWLHNAVLTARCSRDNQTQHKENPVKLFQRNPLALLLLAVIGALVLIALGLDVMSRDVVESVEGYAANRRVVSVVVVEVEPAGQRQASFGL